MDCYHGDPDSTPPSVGLSSPCKLVINSAEKLNNLFWCCVIRQCGHTFCSCLLEQPRSWDQLSQSMLTAVSWEITPVTRTAITAWHFNTQGQPRGRVDQTEGQAFWWQGPHPCGLRSPMGNICHLDEPGDLTTWYGALFDVTFIMYYSWPLWPFQRGCHLQVFSPWLHDRAKSKSIVVTFKKTKQVLRRTEIHCVWPKNYISTMIKININAKLLYLVAKNRLPKLSLLPGTIISVVS